MPVVVGLTEVVKRFLALPEEWEKRVIPVVAIGLGVGFNYLVSMVLDPKPATSVTVAFCIMAGLAASGLWSGSKSVVGK